MEFMQVFKISMGQKEENLTVRGQRDGRKREREGEQVKRMCGTSCIHFSC